MGTFRARPVWVGDKERARRGERPRGGPDAILPDGPPRPASPSLPDLAPTFHVGEPWTPSTDYELTTGRKQPNVWHPCGGQRGVLPCGRPTQLGAIVCADCAVESARTLFLESDQFRDWCAERITTEEYDRGAVRVATSQRELRRRRAAEREANAVHVVYYLRTAPDQVKIGTTGNLANRLRQLYTDPSYLLAVEPGDRELERKRHVEFGRWKTYTHPEAFFDAPELIARVEAIVAEHGPPTAFLHRSPASEDQ